MQVRARGRRPGSPRAAGSDEGILDEELGERNELIANSVALEMNHASPPRKPEKGLGRQDMQSIALLLILYTLQGVPMGLSASIPFLLQNRVSYKNQALFSLVSLPFSLKLLWAPFVDSSYSRPIGRRKSWLIPVQLICGLLMIGAAGVINGWVGEDKDVPNVTMLTFYFLTLYLLMATQDIAVDGWALTMLSKAHVGYGSTCNTIGQALGYFLAHVGFLALNSADTCNKFLRSTPQPYGVVSLGGFVWFWGWVFILTTILVCFKVEQMDQDTGSDMGVVETYRTLFYILKLPNVREMCFILLTVKIAFAVTDSATSLKLLEYGMPKEEAALMSPVLVVTGILIPILLTKYTSGPRPLEVFLHSYNLRLVVGLMYAVLLPFARLAYTVPGFASLSFRAYFLFALFVHEVAANGMWISQMAFFAKISDPVIGGTYMTLLNTISNLGSTWVRSLSLYFLDYTTVRGCVALDSGIGIPIEAPCTSTIVQEMCREMGGKCTSLIDGYYVELAVCTILGVIWVVRMRKRVLKLQDTKEVDWHFQGIKGR